MINIWIHRWNEERNPCDFLRVSFFCWWYQKPAAKANLKTKQNELHIQVQQLTQECERLKQEESQRQAVTSQLRQLQLECGHLRKRQEESESERLKEEESKRQEHALQMQQIQSECDKFRMKQDELQMQVQELTHECERLKQEESQRQAVTSQLQQLQLENEKLKKKEFKFNSLVATAESLKSKVEQFCNECEKCDAEDVSQPDSSWEVCTPMTEASDISGRCFMTDAVFKASEVSDWEVKVEPADMERTTVTDCSTFEWIRVSNQFFRMCWNNTAGTNSLIELLQLQLHVYDVSTKFSRVP